MDSLDGIVHCRAGKGASVKGCPIFLTKGDIKFFNKGGRDFLKDYIKQIKLDTLEDLLKKEEAKNIAVMMFDFKSELTEEEMARKQFAMFELTLIRSNIKAIEGILKLDALLTLEGDDTLPE